MIRWPCKVEGRACINCRLAHVLWDWMCVHAPTPTHKCREVKNEKHMLGVETGQLGPGPHHTLLASPLIGHTQQQSSLRNHVHGVQEESELEEASSVACILLYLTTPARHVSWEPGSGFLEFWCALHSSAWADKGKPMWHWKEGLWGGTHRHSSMAVFGKHSLQSALYRRGIVEQMTCKMIFPVSHRARIWTHGYWDPSSLSWGCARFIVTQAF